MTDLPADRHIEEALRRGGAVNTRVASVHTYCDAYSSVIELARMIEKYEPIPELVDPDLLIVREAHAEACTTASYKSDYLSGVYDNTSGVVTALRAIKLAREKGAL